MGTPSRALRDLAFALPLILLVAIAGCSSGGSKSAAGNDDGGAGGPPGGHLTSVSYHMEETVAAGQEIFKCQLVRLPDLAGWLVSGNHDYTPGSHHLLLYTTDFTSIPAGEDQVQDCYEGTDASIMSHVRGILYGGQTPTGSMQLPSGIGLQTTASQILLFQVHYLNAGSAALDAKVNVNLTIDSGTDITTNAGILFFYDPFIDVPVGAKATAQMRCLIPNDITLLSAQSHYHARGVGYAAYLDKTAASPATQPFYTSASWTSPPQQTMSAAVSAGTRLRFECDYDNSSGTQAYFQGPSAQTNEMCMFIGLYYPDMGALADNCETGPDMFGSGASTCDATLSCLASCGSVDLSQSASPCVQACMVDSCPSATAPLVPILECIGSSCSTQCQTAGTTCNDCIAQQCASQYAACKSTTCP